MSVGFALAPQGPQGLGQYMEEQTLSIYLEDTQQLLKDLTSILRVFV